MELYSMADVHSIMVTPQPAWSSQNGMTRHSRERFVSGFLPISASQNTPLHVLMVTDYTIHAKSP